MRGYNNQEWILNQGKSNHKLMIHRIPTNTHQKVITSNRSPRDHCIEIQREKKPSSYFLRTCRSVVNYSLIIEEAPMRMMNPSVIVFPSGGVPEKGSRLDLVVLELAMAETIFRPLLRVFWNIMV